MDRPRLSRLPLTPLSVVVAVALRQLQVVPVALAEGLEQPNPSPLPDPSPAVPGRLGRACPAEMLGFLVDPVPLLGSLAPAEEAQPPLVRTETRTGPPAWMAGPGARV